MILGFFSSSLMMACRRSSNCPRYLVPATTDDMSSITTRLSCRILDTFFSTILKASPSTMADFPTPGSPIRIGLFFFLRLNICATRSISRSRPTTGSSLPSAAASVMSEPNLSRAGVSVANFLPCFCAKFTDELGDFGELPKFSFISSSASSSSKSMPSIGLLGFSESMLKTSS